MTGNTDDARPEGELHLLTIAMPRDANPAGAIFGGWTLSQMDLAGASFAARRARGRVVTAAVEAMTFLRPIAVGDQVSCHCRLEREGEHSLCVRIETWALDRGDGTAAKVTEGVFTYAAVDDDGHKRELP